MKRPEQSFSWLERFRLLVADGLGLWFDQDKLSWLEEIVLRRSRVARKAPEDYVRALEAPGAADWTALASELTVGETYFFRHSEQMAAFLQVALPERAAVREGKALRLLSVGCSSGEEPYSLAMLARHAGLSEGDTRVLGLDLNPASLRKARAGRYTRWSLRETPDEFRRRWFSERGREFILDPAIVGSVEFRQTNLAKAAPDIWQPRLYDIIFCRNVLMYFTASRAQQIVARLVDSLDDGGFLFLGHAETLRGLCDKMELSSSHSCFYYRKPLAGRGWRGEWPPPALEAPPLPDDWFDVIGASNQRIRSMESGTEPAHLPDRLAPGADLGRVRELFEEERYSEALTALQSLPPEQQDRPEALLLNAVLLIQLNDFGGAELLCRRLLEEGGDLAGAHYLLALCREGHGDRQAAAAEHRAALRQDPGFAMPRLHLGMLARKGGDLATARREFEQALLLLQGEEPGRLRLYGGGFGREALVSLCRSELAACPRGRR